VIFRARHLQEDRLFECYLAEQGSEPIEPPAAEHLTDCAECRVRYGDLRRFMDGLRSEADAALDEIFSPDRFRAQQQHIARRVEQLGRHARVISFPGHRSAEQSPSPQRRGPLVVPHWIGAAAAAGLLVGIGMGSLYYSHAAGVPQQTVAMRNIPVSAGTPVAATAPALVSDVNEQFLSELELALERPHTSELVALDELTPHVRDVRVQLR
jgi:anti-sigma factor RsiW